MPLRERNKVDSKKEKVIAELAKYGITKEAIGPLLLGVLIGVIVE
jgi:hypothetical protein